MTTAEMIAVMQAAKPDGSNVECSYAGYCSWHQCGFNITWNWQEFDYRIIPDQPKPVLVPLEEGDIPPVCWIKGPKAYGYNGYSLILGVFHGGVYTKFSDDFFTFQQMKDFGWEYSPDRRTWKPCSKEVSQ